MKNLPEKEKSETGNFWLAAAVCAGAIVATTVINKRRNSFSFAGKTVLITGGSRGLGLVMAREFAKEKAKIAICARNGADLERARMDLKERGAEVAAIVCDVRDQEQVNQMIEAVRNRFGQIDVLINNAGVIQVGPLEEQTQEDFENAMAVHYWAAYYTMSAVLPEMQARREGRIVNITSIGAKIAVPHLTPYCASKFAVAGLSSAIQAEVYKDGVYVTTVYPGLMRTGSHINAFFKGQNEKEFAWFSISNALPVSSVSAEHAAQSIIESCRRGDAEKIISPQAAFAIKLNGIFPELVSTMTGLVNQFILPAPGGIGDRKARGLESTSYVSPSFLTTQLDKASAKNNELKPGEQLNNFQLGNQ
ncbi:MAG TPA: SDR family oxidoreductase [Pyrinomonadaceae bacterium]|nr:SDR family oxidoreductase [Pyrinomonadaceae bacterium]